MKATKIRHELESELVILEDDHVILSNAFDSLEDPKSLSIVSDRLLEVEERLDVIESLLKELEQLEKAANSKKVRL